MTDIVTTEVTCGLGNQALRFLAALNVAKKQNKKLILEKVSKARSDFFDRPVYWDSIFHQFETLPTTEFSELKFTDYHDVQFAFRDVPTIKGNLRLRGDYQAEKHFRELKPEISRMLTLPEDQMNEVNRIWQALVGEHKHVVSLHVRRQDYATCYANHHNLLTIDYYKRAISSLEKLVDDATNLFYLIFTDDSLWCKHIVSKIIPKGEVVTIGTDVQQFFLMSKCQHHIIANSTFSFLAAYLAHCNHDLECKNFYLAPKHWIKDNEQNTRKVSVLLPDWFLILE